MPSESKVGFKSRGATSLCLQKFRVPMGTRAKWQADQLIIHAKWHVSFFYDFDRHLLLITTRTDMLLRS